MDVADEVQLSKGAQTLHALKSTSHHSDLSRRNTADKPMSVGWAAPAIHYAVERTRMRHATSVQVRARRIPFGPSPTPRT